MCAGLKLHDHQKTDNKPATGFFTFENRCTVCALTALFAGAVCCQCLGVALGDFTAWVAGAAVGACSWFVVPGGA